MGRILIADDHDALRRGLARVRRGADLPHEWTAEHRVDLLRREKPADHPRLFDAERRQLVVIGLTVRRLAVADQHHGGHRAEPTSFRSTCGSWRNRSADALRPTPSALRIAGTRELVPTTLQASSSVVAATMAPSRSERAHLRAAWPRGSSSDAGLRWEADSRGPKLLLLRGARSRA